MKRTVALWAAVSMFILATWAAESVAQYEKPTSPPPPPPREASGDTLKTGTEATTTPPKAAPATAPTPTDTLTASARIRRAQKEKTTYAISFALGSAFGAYGGHNQSDPATTLGDVFSDEFDPSFGLYLGAGARRWDLELSLSFDFNFFFTTRQNPEDLNTVNLFLNLKYLPLHSTARPYVLACAGYWRSWIVDPLDPNDLPQTVMYVGEGGDYVYQENVLGYGGGVGVEVEIDKTRRIFLEARYVQGQTRQTYQHENLAIIPVRLGLTWEM